MTDRSLPSLLVAAAFALPSVPVVASCGSAYCTLMTDRYAQGTGEPHLGWSADFRLEQLTQDRLRSGTRRIDASEVTGEEAIERSTSNLNAVTTLAYGFGDAWSIGLRVPVLRRHHVHDLVDEETGAVGPTEQWRFTRPGDVSVVARRQTASEDEVTSYAVFGGLKLPTGSYTVANEDGVRAERSLQPGSGTTDLIVGAAGRRALTATDAGFVQGSVTHALNSRDDYRPGTRFELGVGWSHAFSETLGAVLQLNAQHRLRDSGAQAEPDNSGSTRVDFSPGITAATGSASTVYAYVQLPVYQRVNGVQLVPRWAFAVGWTADF